MDEILNSAKVDYKLFSDWWAELEPQIDNNTYEQNIELIRNELKHNLRIEYNFNDEITLGSDSVLD